MPEETCTHNCSTCPSHQNGSCGASETDKAIADQLAKIKNKIVVLSGKGGVGKSTVAVNLAMALALNGFKTGLMDVDLHGPSIPTMLGLQNVQPEVDGKGQILPIQVYGLSVISVAFFLPNQDDPVIWRGPLKQGAMQQFLGDVEWGELDYLVIDCPPGTGDEPLGICQLVADRKAVIVTTPQEVAAADVRRSVNFCKKLDMEILGVIENMSGFVCPHCNEVTYIFNRGGGEKLANDMGIPFLGHIPLEATVGESSDAGKPFIAANPASASAKAFADIVDKLLAR